MELDDYVDPKVGLAVAATAVALSPRVRDVLHRGAVYGLAGILATGDAVSSLARGIGDGARRARTRGERATGDEAAGANGPDAEAGGSIDAEERGGAPSARRRQRRPVEPLEDDEV